MFFKNTERENPTPVISRGMNWSLCLAGLSQAWDPVLGSVDVD